MIRRAHRLITSACSNRKSRRATEARLRANRSDEKMMQVYNRRAGRIGRYRQAFRRFIPINLASFRASWLSLIHI